MKKLQFFVITYLTKHLLKAVSSEDILTITNKGWFSRGRQLAPDEKMLIKEEAEALRTSILWKYLSTELEYIAFVRGRQATKEEDLWATLYLYYNLDIIQQFLDRCRRL